MLMRDESAGGRSAVLALLLSEVVVEFVSSVGAVNAQVLFERLVGAWSLAAAAEEVG